MKITYHMEENDENALTVEGEVFDLLNQMNDLAEEKTPVITAVELSDQERIDVTHIALQYAWENGPLEPIPDDGNYPSR